MGLAIKNSGYVHLGKHFIPSRLVIYRDFHRRFSYSPWSDKYWPSQNAIDKTQPEEPVSDSTEIVLNLTLQLQESFLVMPRNDPPFCCSLKTFQSLSTLEPCWMITTSTRIISIWETRREPYILSTHRASQP